MTLAEEIAENIMRHVERLCTTGVPLVPYAVVAMTVDPRSHRPLPSPQPVCVPLPDGIEAGAAALVRLSLVTSSSIMATVTGASDKDGNDHVVLVVQTKEDSEHAILWTAPVLYPTESRAVLGEWQKSIEEIHSDPMERALKVWHLLGGGKEAN